MASRMSDFLGQVGEHLPQFLTEYRQAFELLDTRSLAEHVEPFPFISATHPFSVRRFALVRERLIARGQAAYLTGLDNPAGISAIDTGPDLTAYDIVADRTPWTIAELIQILGTKSGQLKRGENYVSISAELPGTYCEPAKQFDWDYDPEEHPFELACDVEPVPDFLDLAWPEEATLELDWAEHFQLQTGERRPILDAAGDHITYTAGAMVIDALQPQRLLPSVVKHSTPEVELRMGASWGPIHRTKARGSIQVDLPALLAMPTRQRQATLAGMLAHVLVELMPDKAAERSQLERLRDSWFAETPEGVMTGLGLRPS
jgi:hypothetical protein